jgi:hypothetical protein
MKGGQQGGIEGRAVHSNIKVLINTTSNRIRS